MPEMMHWGDIIFSLLGFILLFAVIATTVVLLAKFVIKERGKEAKELNEKLDKIIWLLEKNNDDFQK